MPVTFDALLQHYPTAPKEKLFPSMGGEWPSLVDDERYANTCAVRLSLALNGAGLPISTKFREAIKGDGTPLIIKVATMGRFLTEALGKWSWGISKQPGHPINVKELPHRKCILVYHVQWKDATGHFDLWTGSKFIGSGDLSDIQDGFELQAWFVD